MRIDRRTAVIAVAAMLLLPATQATALAEPDDDPDLEQTIDPDQDVSTEETVLDLGHVDMGPRFPGGTWTLMIHDDTQLEGSVWRPLDSTVIQVRDAAQLTVPEDETYSFLGAEPGAQVHVIPQTQNSDVVWLGWNTQDPQVLDSVDRGASLTLESVTGPGELIVYLQDGGFGPPRTLWDSRQAERQDLWVDINTHTHANWVFSDPGVYLVELTASADLVDGSSVEDTQVLRLSVGDETDPADALTAEAEPRSEAAEADEPVETSDGGGISWLVWVAVAGAVALGLVLGVVLTLVRGRRIKREAARGPQGATDAGEDA